MGCLTGSLTPARLLMSTPRRARPRAWRNILCGAINAGLERGLFSLEPDDVDQCVYPFLFPAAEPIEGVAHVRAIDRDELAVHAALWPTPRGAELVRCYNGGFRAGAAFAAGWLERREGAWLQTSRRRMFTCRLELLPLVAGAEVVPLGYRDRGRLM